MAKTVFSYLFLVVILFSSSYLTIHARESKFFTHLGTITIKPRNAIKPSLSPIGAPSPALSPFAAELAPSPAETLTPAPAPGSENERSNLFPSKKEENEIFDEEFDGENYQYNNNYKNQNSYAAKNYNNYNSGYGYKLASEDHETANQNNYNGFTGNGYDEELARGNGYTTGNQNDKYYNYYNSNGYESNQRQGMSDTRYVAGGRNYYNNGKKTDYPGTEAGRVINTQNQGYYGNFENQNKYNNNMEYENQELYNENQEEEFLP